MAALATVLSRPPPPDPDIQAALSDYLGLTEALPSSLTRALTLIEHLRHRSEQRIASVHRDTTTFSLRPTLKDSATDPVQLRRNISHALDQAERASRMALEEASRLVETGEREARRLDTVVEQLKSQPMPPSRDPTPEQQALTSPNLKRDRRMSVRDDDPRPEKAMRVLDDRAAVKLRGRKIMVPGEVLPPPDPNAAPESISDWTSRQASPVLDEIPLNNPGTSTSSNNNNSNNNSNNNNNNSSNSNSNNSNSNSNSKQTLRPRSRTPKIPKAERDREKKPLKSRGFRPSGQPGSNAHSSIAGISTSNALLALTPPPEGASKGSKWLPWMKLTEWEMAKLRKRMKKNAIWVPSQTMVRRELKILGRGVTGREAARAAEESGGEPFLDESDEADPTRVLISGEESAQVNVFLGLQVSAEDDDADAELINRGMRLNEAKKLKRQRMLEEQALQAQLAREQGVELPADVKLAVSQTDQKKRRRESSPSADTDVLESSLKSAPLPKKLRISGSSAQSTTSKVSLAPPGPSLSPRAGFGRTQLAATPPAARKPSLAPNAGKAVSEEPPTQCERMRRGSNVSLPNSPDLPSPAETSATGPGRRSKRPAPGIVTSGDNESAKVGVSQRKAAPKKKGGSVKSASTNAEMGTPGTIEAVEEYIDPNEPRYCLCGDVSWGTMIACDNEDSCENQWFHLSCVGLSELPPRRTKWYCPDCRKRLKLGQTTNGLVGRAQGR